MAGVTIDSETGYGPVMGIIRIRFIGWQGYQTHVRRERTMETMIGRVTHYYPKIGVAAVILEGHIAKGDRIHIHGPHDDIHQSVTSIEIEHVSVKEAEHGQDIGIKVNERVHEGDVVFRVS